MWDELTMKLLQNTSLKGHFVMTHCARLNFPLSSPECASAMTVLIFSLHISSILMTQSRNWAIINFHLNSLRNLPIYTQMLSCEKTVVSCAWSSRVPTFQFKFNSPARARKNILAVYYNCRSFNVAITERIVKWNVKSDEFNGLLIMLRQWLKLTNSF
jgi:hypothetical protein